MHTSKMGLLLHMILHITPLFIGLAELHRFISSPDLSPYSAVLMKTEWLQENFMVADKIYHFFCGNEMMSDNWSGIKWDAYSSGQVQGTLLGNSQRWICQQDFIFPVSKSIQLFLYTCVFFFVCFFLSQSCKSIFTFIGEMYMVDMTWFPNSSMQENMDRESSPSHLLKVHGPLG